MFLDFLENKNGSINKFNKNLLNKRPAIQLPPPPKIGTDGLVFSTCEKTELHADLLESQFSLNYGPEIPEVIDNVQKISSATILCSNTFTTPSSIQILPQKADWQKSLEEDNISNVGLKFLPVNMNVILTKIINRYLRISYFQTA